MCGIIFEALYPGYSGANILKDERVLQRLKNRGPNSCNVVEFSTKTGFKIMTCGAVLSMRGIGVTPQPVENSSGILLYNGDIYDDTLDSNDTQLIMQIFSETSSVDQKINRLKSLKGPFSIIFYDKTTEELYFMRDRFGRNSLLFHKSDISVIISSVLGRKYKCVEIPAQHIHIWSLRTNTITAYMWQNDTERKENKLDDWFAGIIKTQSLPDEQFKFQCDLQQEDYNEDDVIKYINSTVRDKKCKLTHMQMLLDDKTIQNTVLTIKELLKKSVKKRMEAQPFKCKTCLFQDVVCRHASVGVLFSGGLDCTILAFLADKYVPAYQSIDLINVAFKKGNTSYDVPDRLTGRQSYAELKKMCPSRQWNFKEINISQEELEDYQRSTIADLVHPRQTILDESLGSALWFAARGKDDMSTSSCRVLLLGSGADELFGGYTRHRNALRRDGWTGLDKELQLDWKRISYRNLARDDRVICDHGRQARLPYLDEDFTSYVLKLKPWLRCFPSDSLPQGVGDKLMLRLVALGLGLTEVVTFPKRALQFGTRIANKKEKGSDISKSFRLQINS